MTAVFHRIGEPSRETFTNSIEQILAYEGEVTFDGVYTSVYDHKDVLKDRGIILFAAGDTIGEPGFCNWAQLLVLTNKYGFKLGWHTWTHRKLTEINGGELLEEMTSPFPTKYIAYPHGDYNHDVLALATILGYERGYSTTQGSNETQFSIYREYL